MNRLPKLVGREEVQALVINSNTFTDTASRSVTVTLVAKGGGAVASTSIDGGTGEWDSNPTMVKAYEMSLDKLVEMENYHLKRMASYCNKVQIEPPTDMDKLYVGIHVGLVKFMFKGDYFILRGWELPEGEDPMQPGYLVMDGYDTEGKEANVGGYPHYVQWLTSGDFYDLYDPVNEEAVVTVS